MSRMVLEAGLLAEAVVGQQRWAHLPRRKHRIVVNLAAGLLTTLWIRPVQTKTYPTQYVPRVWQTEQGLPQNGLLGLLWTAQLRLRQLQRAFNMRLEERVEERTRIARELHDTLLQSFQGLMFSFQAARNLLPGRTEAAIRTLDGAMRKGDEAVGEGRDAIQNLRLGSAERRLEDLLAATGQELRTHRMRTVIRPFST